MKRLIVLGAALLVAGCANAIKPQHVTEDEISFEYDTLLNSWGAVQERAERHCATQGKKAEVVSRWDNFSVRGATFRCV